MLPIWPTVARQSSQDQTHFARSQAEGGVLAFFRHELRGAARGADHLAAFAGHHLDVMDQSTDRDERSGRALPGLMSAVSLEHDHVADFEADRPQHVALVAIGVMHQGDARRAIRIVLDRRDLAGNAVFVALEVNDAVQRLVAAGGIDRRAPALVVPPAAVLVGPQQRLFGLATPSARNSPKRCGTAGTASSACIV